MNLRQLINSNARVITNKNTSYKNFTECDLGNVISINTRSHIDRRLGLINIVMYITAVTAKKSSIETYHRPNKRSNFVASRSNISTYTTAISFSDYWELNISFEELVRYTRADYEGSTEEGKKSMFSETDRKRLEKRLIREAEIKYNKGEKFKWKGEAAKAIGEISDEERLTILIEPRVKRYIDKWAHMSEEIEWQKGRSKGSLEVQKEYTCKQLYVRGYKIKLEGENVRVYTPITIDNRVRVMCTCPQFFYTYAWYNADKQVLIGPRPPAYVTPFNKKLLKLRRKADETIRNINKLPGMCKHLQFMISYLIDIGMLDPLNSTVTKNIYKSTSSRAVLKDVINSSNNSNTYGNSKDIATAEKEYKTYLREKGRTVDQIKLFGEEKPEL